MRLSILTATFACLASICTAEDRELSGQEITELLPKIIAYGVGTDTVQTFETSGLTEYSGSGRPTIGTWWATDSQYCSTWPPATTEACYTVLLDEAVLPPRITWISDKGARIYNDIEPRP